MDGMGNIGKFSLLPHFLGDSTRTCSSIFNHNYDTIRQNGIRSDKMGNVQFVIFDMDGLLFDTERLYYRSFQKAAKKLGYEFPFEHYLKVVGVTDDEGKKILAEIYGEDSLILHAFDHYHGELNDIITEEGLSLKPGVEKLLDMLDEKGIHKCIASSSSLEVIRKYTEYAQIADRFDFFISGTEVEHGKPSPDIFLEALKRGGATAEFALVLEDSLHGLKAAVSANIRCIIVPDLIEPTEEMKRQAFRICRDLGEVAEMIKEG